MAERFQGGKETTVKEAIEKLLGTLRIVATMNPRVRDDLALITRHDIETNLKKEGVEFTPEELDQALKELVGEGELGVRSLY